MAKKSTISRNERRRVLAARYLDRRVELQEIVRRPSSTDEERSTAQAALQRLPREASPAWVRNQDAVDGRHAVTSARSGSCRVRIRDLTHRSELPGIRKSGSQPYDFPKVQCRRRMRSAPAPRHERAAPAAPICHTDHPQRPRGSMVTPQNHKRRNASDR